MCWRNAFSTLFIVIFAASAAGQAIPSTQPGQTGAWLLLELNFNDEETHELLPGLRSIFEDVLRDAGTAPTTGPARGRGPQGLKIGGLNGSRDGIRQAIRFYYDGADAEKLLNGLQARLEKMAHDRTAMSDEIAASEMEKLNTELYEITSRSEQIVKLMQSRQKVLADVAVDKMKALEIERQKLQMDLAAKGARAKAVREQMHKLEAVSQSLIDEDAVAKQLEKVIQLKQKELDATKKLMASGNASSAEVTEKETAVAEAQARVAERADAVRQSHNGDLMNRLATEVATLAIDEAEMQERYRTIAERLPPDDIKQLSEGQLKQLVEMYVVPVVDGSYMPPQWEQLEQRKRPLLARKLALELVEVKSLNGLPTTRGRSDQPR